MGKYDNMLHLSRPKSDRTPMSVADRAKIFMPFAALRGYEEAIGEAQREMNEKQEIVREEFQEAE